MNTDLRNLSKEELIEKSFEQAKIIEQLNSKINILKNELHPTFNLFDSSPTPMWEEDITELINYLNKIRETGISDFNNYFISNPKEVDICISKIRMINVNRAAVELHKAESKQQLLNNFERIFTENSKNAFINELVAIANGKTNYIGYTNAFTFTNEFLYLKLYLQITKKEYDNKLKYYAIVSTVNNTEQKQIEDKLNNNEKALRTIIDASEDIAILVDKKGFILESNKACQDFYKVKKIDFIGRKLKHFASGEVVKNRLVYFNRAITEKQNLTFENNAYDKKWISSVSPLFDKDNEVEKVVIFHRDVTAKYSAEKKIKESELKYTLIFQNIKTSIAHINPQGFITDINNYHIEHIGKGKARKEDYIGTNILKRSSIIKAGIVDDYKKLLKGKEIILKNVYFPETPGGGSAYFNIQGIPLFEGNKFKGAIITTEDVTNFEVNRQKLAEVEQRLTLTLEGTEIGLWDHDIVNNKVWRSDGWYTMLGLDKSNFNESSEVWYNLIHPDDLEATNRAVISHRKNNTTNLKIEHRLKNAAGDYQWILNWGKVIERDAQGNPLRAAGIHIDITNLKEAREKSIQSIQRYKYLFENQPTAIWEEDFHSIKQRLDNLKAQGITDFDQYFEDHTEVVKEFAAQIKIVEMNPASLKILEADSIDELSRLLPDYFNSENAWEVFKNEIVALANGAVHFESEISVKTIKGNVKHLYLVLTVHPLHKDDFKSILVSFQDITAMKESALKLAETQKKYTTLVEQANEGILVTQGWEIKYSNKHLYNMLGYTHDEILKVPIEKLLSNSENANLIKGRFERRIKGDQIPNIYESEAITKDGKIIPIEINAQIMEYDGRPAVQSIVRDISERKASQEEKERHQKELDLIYNATSDIMALIKVDGHDLKLISFNNSFWESVHTVNSDLTKADLLNSSVYDSDKLFLWSKSIKEKMLVNYEKVLDSFESIESFELVKFGPITKYFRIKLTPIFDDQGNCSHILLVVQDLTERRNIEEKNKFLAELLESSPLAYSITDLEGIIVDVNPALEELTGYSRNELLGNNPNIFNAEQNAQEIQLNIFKILDDKNVWDGEILNKKKNGVLFYNHITIFPLFKKDGTPYLYAAFNEDVTEKRLAQEALIESEKYLKETQMITQLGTYKLDIAKDLWTSSEELDHIFGIDSNFERNIAGWAKILHPECKDVMEDYFKIAVLGNKNKFDKEYKILRYNDKVERWVHGIGELKYDENNIPISMVGTIRDITERINADNLIREQDEYVKSIFSSAPIGIGVVSNGILKKINLKLCNMLGYNQDELIGKSSRILHSTDEEFIRVGEEIYAQIEKIGTGILETKWETKDGDTLDILLSSTPIYQNDLSKGVTFTALDITERKEAEEALLKSRQRFKSLFHDSPIPLWEENLKELLEYINSLKEKGIVNFREYFDNNVEDILKCSRMVKVERVNKATIEIHKAKNKEDLLGNLDKIFTEKSLKVFKEEIIAIAQGEKSFESEGEVRTLTGELIFIFLRFTLHDNYRALLATVDITERKNTELALAKSETRLSTLMNNIPGMAYQCLADNNWTMTFVNQECAKLTGYLPNQLLNNKDISYSDIIHQDDRELVKLKVEDKLNTGEPFEIEYRIITKNGSEKWVWERGIKVKDKNNNHNVLEGVIHDITERKIAEKAFKELAQFNHQILDAAMDGYILADTNGNILEINPSYCKMIGYSHSELLMMNVKQLEVELPKEVFEERARAMMSSGGVNFRSKHMHKNGYPIDLDVSITIVNKNEDILIAALVRDITEQIKVGEQIKESEEKYRMLIENQTDLVVEVDNLNRFKFVSPSYCVLFGKSEDELLGYSFIPLVHEDDRLATEKEMENLFKEPFTCKIEQRAMTANGWRCLEWYNKAIFDEDKNIISVFGIGRDITEKKEAEIKIKESEEKFKQLFNNMRSGVAIYDVVDSGTNFILADLNKSGEELYELKKESVIGKKITDVIPSILGKGVFDVLKNVYQNNIPEQLPQVFFKDKRIERWLDNYVYKLPTGQLVAIFEDISVEKKAVEALQNNEEDLRAILNTSFDVIFLIDRNGKIIEVNNVFCNLVDKKREELLNEIFSHYMKSDNEIKRKILLDKIISTKKHSSFIDESYRKIWEYSVYPILDSNGEVVRLTIFAKDITDKSIFEKRLKQSNEKLRNLTRYMNNIREEERKNVAREVHDNLGQKLTALNLDISWIKQSIPDEISQVKEQFDPVLELINESIITVQKISTELRPGILDDLGLVNAIQWQSNEINRRSNLNFSLNLFQQELDLEDDVKTALFRVYQEALTNIVRHSEATTVLVNLLIKEKKLIFEVIDDGKGISETNISDFRSYGIMGMKERIDSINGNITFTNLEKGTKLQISIPIEE